MPQGPAQYKRNRVESGDGTDCPASTTARHLGDFQTALIISEIYRPAKSMEGALCIRKRRGVCCCIGHMCMHGHHMLAV